MASRPAPCGCGAKDKCQPKEKAVKVYPPAAGRGDPAEHFATLGGYEAVKVAHGHEAAWDLWSRAKLWARDGAGSPWHNEYWTTWDRQGQDR